MVSNNKIEPILAKIRSAAKPERFNRELVKNLGFGSSSERAIITVLRELGFVGDGAIPTADYDRLRDSMDWKYVLGEKFRELYSDLYALDTNIHNAPDEEVKGAISRITGKDEKSVARYFSTFKTLASLAKFEPKPTQNTPKKPHEPESATPAIEKPQPVHIPSPPQEPHREPVFHYNIQIHLPATTDISVYNAIFKSLKENLAI